MQEFDRLKKKVIDNAELEDGCVYLMVNDGTVYELSAYGDCCSKGWLSNLKAPQTPFVIDHEFAKGSYESIESNHPDFPPGGDVVVRNEMVFHTSNGPLKFYMWNDSNGYYGSTLQIDVEKFGGYL